MGKNFKQRFLDVERKANCCGEFKSVSSDLTIDTTPITGGSTGYPLYHKSGNVVGEFTGAYFDTVNNRVGIGTTTPAGKLHVKGVGTDVIAQFNSALGSNYMKLLGNGNSLITGAYHEIGKVSNPTTTLKLNSPESWIIMPNGDWLNLMSGFGIATWVSSSKSMELDLNGLTIYGTVLKGANANGLIVQGSGLKLSFYGGTPITKPLNKVAPEVLQDLGLVNTATYAVEDTGTTISFFRPTIYNSPTMPATGNITYTLIAGSKIGVVQKLYHNHSTAPTFPAGTVLVTGNYVTSTLNIIELEWVSGTRVEIRIAQG